MKTRIYKDEYGYVNGELLCCTDKKIIVESFRGTLTCKKCLKIISQKNYEEKIQKLKRKVDLTNIILAKKYLENNFYDLDVI